MRESIIERIKGDEVAIRQACMGLGIPARELDGIGGRECFSCLMPDHPDVVTLSMSCHVESATFTCFGRCDGVKTVADLVIAYGKAEDYAGAMAWLDELFGVESSSPSLAPVDVVFDPSLRVEQYAYQLHLPHDVIRRFRLENVRAYMNAVSTGAKAKLCSWEEGWYDAVFMPYHSGAFPRVRANRPDRKNWNAQTIQRASGAKEKWATRKDLRAGAYGLDQIDLHRVAKLRLVAACEGESDVLCTHAAALLAGPSINPLPILGVPGVNAAPTVAQDIVHVISEAAKLLSPGGWRELLHTFTIVVGTEPGGAGAKLAGKIDRALDEYVNPEGSTYARVPQVASFNWNELPGSPGDAKDLWTALHDESVHGLIESAAIQAARTKQAPLALAALAAPSPPAPSPESPTPAATSTEVAVIDAGVAEIITWPEDDVWAKQMRVNGAPPVDLDVVPVQLEGLDSTFRRSAKGWVVTRVKDGVEVGVDPVCTHVCIHRVESTGEQNAIRAGVYSGKTWHSIRILAADASAPDKLSKALCGAGLFVAARKKNALIDLIAALAMLYADQRGIELVPAGTGWMSVPGGEHGGPRSLFGGIDVEPIAELSQMMYEANCRRREDFPDVEAAAHEWFERGVLPLLKADRSGPPSTVLALGAAAAGPLLAPLTNRGVGISPVTWLAGMGGGGKTMTQNLCASIFAPQRSDIDGTASFFANADITRAALSARTIMCRDLPLILDDVMQLPGLGSGSKPGTDAAKAENAAGLGMMIHNRKPVERSNSELQLRLMKPFRSSAIFSAEISLTDEHVGAKISAGQFRRIQTVETMPLDEAGLTRAHAELVNELLRDLGGSAADLMIPMVRDLVATGELKQRMRAASDEIKLVASSLETTQRQALMINALGFELLAQACGYSDVHGVPARSYAIEMMAKYIEQGGGATAETLERGDVLLEKVIDLYGSNPLRFKKPDFSTGDYETDLYHQSTHSLGSWGKLTRIKLDSGWRQAIALTGEGMEALKRKPGVTAQMIQGAIGRGECIRNHPTNMWNETTMRTHAFLLPKDRERHVLEAVDPEPQPMPNAPSAPTPEEQEIIERFSDPVVVPEPEQVPDEPPGSEHEGDNGDNSNDETHADTVPCTEYSEPHWTCTEQVPITPEDSPAPTQEQTDDFAEWMESNVSASDHASTLLTQEYHRHRGTHRRTVYVQGDYVLTAIYKWATGTYAPDEGVRPHDKDLLDHIRSEAQLELDVLIDVMKHQPEGPVEVAPLPRDDAPNWSQLTAKGAEWARGLHLEASRLLTQALDPDRDHPSRLQALGEYAKVHRLNLLARYRHPVWFVDA